MADILIRIRSLSGSFSAAQKQLAGYVIANSEDIPFLSVHELANAAGVSVASISRFARAVGCLRPPGYEPDYSLGPKFRYIS